MAKRKRSIVERRAEKRLAEAQAEVANLERLVAKYKPRSECFHDAKERYYVHRRTGPNHWILTRCGYCGREIAGRRADAEEALKQFGESYFLGYREAGENPEPGVQIKGGI